MSYPHPDLGVSGSHLEEGVGDLVATGITAICWVVLIVISAPVWIPGLAIGWVIRKVQP